jgi:hypothetical protein
VMAVVRISDESRFPKLNAVRAMMGLPPLSDNYPHRVVDHDDDREPRDDD